MLMDIFGACSRAQPFAGDVADQYKVFDRPQNVGHFFLAMKPDLFVSKKEYRARMDTLVERVRACPKAEASTLDPAGPGSSRRARKKSAAGAASVQRRRDRPVQDEAVRAGVAKLDVSANPFDS